MSPTPAEIAAFNRAMFDLSVAQRDAFEQVAGSGIGVQDAPAGDVLAQTAKLQAAAAALA